MKILFMFLLLTCFIHSQQIEISATAISILSGTTLYYQMLDRQNFADGNPIYKKYSKTWHSLQTIETLSYIGLGVQVSLVDEMQLDKILFDALLIGSIRWIVRDATYQILQGNKFDHISDNSYSQIETIGTPLLKFSILGVLLFLKYFFFPGLI